MVIRRTEDAQALLSEQELQASHRGMLVKRKPGWLWALIVAFDEKRPAESLVDCRHILPSDLNGSALTELVATWRLHEAAEPGCFMVRIFVASPSGLAYSDVVKLPSLRS